jgi:hypothetical protein
MPEQELEVMGSEVCDSGAPGGSVHNMPNGSRCDVLCPPITPVPDLKVVELQPYQLGAPEAASDQNRQDSPIPLSPGRIRVGRSQQRTALICCQPIP